jgi:hypothetical protein
MAGTITPRRVVCALAATAVLCVLAYWRSLSLPLISDDYLQIQLGRDYGPVSGWAALAGDPLYRCRATSLLITYWTERIFGLSATAFNVSSLVLHLLNTWLVLAAGACRRIGWRVSVAAACFFAVYEGHQEAVMWYAALPELLVFLFGVGALLLWVAWIRKGGGEARYLGALACFVLALLSKESAVAVVPLMAAAACYGLRWRTAAFRLAPFTALTVLYVALIFAARSTHYFFHDGTFSLRAPFWVVLPVSIGRLLWVWGALALLAIALCRAGARIAAMAAIWIPITLLPYCFLTYMPRVPSRHTYLASAGLAVLVGFAFQLLRDRGHVRTAAAVATIVVVSQCGYIWTKKQRQLMERAAPTERLLRMARGGGPVLRIRCFPYPPEVAQKALEVHALRGVRLIFDAGTPSTDFCVN